MTRILVCSFVATAFLFTSNTFAGDRRCGYRTSCPPVGCGTVVSHGGTSCGTNCPTVGFSTAVNNGCAACSDGAYQNGVVAQHDGIVIGNGAGVQDNGGGIENGTGPQNNGKSGIGGGVGSPLDPDVLAGQTGSPQGQGDFSTERIWTDSSGKYKRLATFVGVEGTKVILRNAQGRTTRIDIMMLSEEDQRLIDQLRKASTAGTLPTTHEPLIARRP